MVTDLKKRIMKTMWITLLWISMLVVIAPGAKAATMVQVGLTVSGSTVQISGDGLLLDPNDCIVTQINDGNSVKITADGGQVLLNGNSYPWLRAVPNNNNTEAFLVLNGKPYRGDLYLNTAGNIIKVLNELDLEEYLLGVVPKEMSPSWPLEALKAQAVAARTFALKNLNMHRADGFNLCDTSHCQVYGGITAEHPYSSMAVRETAGIVIKYDGDLIDAYYHASSGGCTETVSAVWGGQDRPYLKAVDDGTELAGPYASWQVSFSPENMGERLAQTGYLVGSVQQIEILTRTPSGRAASVFVRGNLGSEVISGTRFRQALNLQSTLFDIHGLPDSKEAWAGSSQVNVLAQSTQGSFTTSVSSGTHVITATGARVLESRIASDALNRGRDKNEIVLKGRGYGHGVGLSQWGAKILAEKQTSAGEDFFTQILTHYYKGVTIEPY